MDLKFRPLRKETVMCTVQGCTSEATFLFTLNGTSRPDLAAYCDRHAKDTAARHGCAWSGLGEEHQSRAGAARSFRTELTRPGAA